MNTAPAMFPLGASAIPSESNVVLSAPLEVLTLKIWSNGSASTTTHRDSVLPRLVIESDLYAIATGLFDTVAEMKEW